VHAKYPFIGNYGDSYVSIYNIELDTLCFYYFTFKPSKCWATAQVTNIGMPARKVAILNYWTKDNDPQYSNPY